MSTSLLNYEVIINLKDLDIISLRQTGFYQLRLTLYQTNQQVTHTSSQNHITARPYLTLSTLSLDHTTQKTQKSSVSVSNTYESKQSSNSSEIDDSNKTFLSSKFIVRNIVIMLRHRIGSQRSIRPAFSRAISSNSTKGMQRDKKVKNKGSNKA